MDSKKSLRYSYSHAVAGQEDCLYLNIYSPVSAGSEGAAALPVMVWIYGGGYSGGYNTARGYGPQKFMDTQRVILVTDVERSSPDIKRNYQVTINYRLSSLGWITLGAGEDSVRGEDT